MQIHVMVGEIGKPMRSGNRSAIITRIRQTKGKRNMIENIKEKKTSM